MRIRFTRSRMLASFAVVGIAIALVAVSSLAPRHGGGGAGDDRVVATLHHLARAYSPALRASLRAARDNPDNLPAAKQAARALIGEGRDLGDSRLVGAAIGMLRGFSANPDAETLFLEATARQYQHDFPGALALLDRAVAQEPDDVNTLLSRAFIHTVLGHFDTAEADCDRIGLIAQAEVAGLCRSTALLLTAEAPAIARRLEQSVAAPARIAPELVPWATGLLGEIAMLWGDDAAAVRYFGQVIGADTTVIRERLLLADVLLRQGAAADVQTLLAAAPDIDGVLVRRALAARALGQADTPVTNELARRVQLNLDLGLTAHAREEAMYFLLLAKDPKMGLERAKVNWAMQHEIEDAQLLLDAAMAAGLPAEGAPVIAWIAEQGVVVPTLRIPQAVKDAAQ